MENKTPIRINFNGEIKDYVIDGESFSIALAQASDITIYLARPAIQLPFTMVVKDLVMGSIQEKEEE